jgi:hypothetical protein
MIRAGTEASPIHRQQRACLCRALSSFGCRFTRLRITSSCVLRRATAPQQSNSGAKGGTGAKVDRPLRLLVLTGLVPSPSQQNPARLADALGAKEISTAEKAGKPQ